MGTQCGKSAVGITAQYEDCHASASKASPHPLSSSKLGAPELRVSLEFPGAKLLCSIQVSDAQAAGAGTGNLRACFFKRLTALCFWSPPHPTFSCLCLFCFGLHHSPFWIIVPPTRNWTWAQTVRALSPKCWTAREFPTPDFWQVLPSIPRAFRDSAMGIRWFLTGPSPLTLSAVKFLVFFLCLVTYHFPICFPFCKIVLTSLSPLFLPCSL